LKNNIKAHIAVLFTTIFFSTNFTAVKFLIDRNLIMPFGLNFLRISVSTILLWCFFVFKKEKEKVERKDMGRIILCSITGNVLNQFLFIEGLSLSTPIHGALLMLTTPILITFFAAAFLGEKINRNKIIGLILGITGATFLILSRTSIQSGSNILLGDILIFLNAVSYTIYFVIVKPLIKKYNAITIIRLMFTFGFIISIPFCWNQFTHIPWDNYSLTSFTVLGLIVIGGTTLAYMFNIYGINKLGASITGNYIYLQPVFATIIAICFHADHLDLQKCFSAVLIFLGLFLANKKTDNV